MEIVHSDWKEVPWYLIPQDLSDFYRKINEKMNDERFFRQFRESELSNATQATTCILDRLNFISTAIAATQDYEYGLALSLRNDLQAKTEGLRTFYDDFVKFQHNLASYLDHEWHHHFTTQETLVKELQTNAVMVNERLKEIMNGIKTVYEKPPQTNQADLDTPHILMNLDKLDKNVKILEARLLEESASKRNLEKEDISELKRYIASAHSSLVENTRKTNEELYAKLKRDQIALKEDLISQIKRQKDYSESLEKIEKKIEQKQVTTCKFRDILFTEPKGEPSIRRIRNDGLDETSRVASPTPSIGHQNMMIQRLRDSSSNIRTWWKERNISHPLQWKEWGEIDWKYAEESINNGHLPPVRYIDLFREGAIPKTPNYNMTYCSRNHVLQKNYTEIQVFEPDWLRSRGTDRNFQFLTFGLFQARIQGLHRPQNGINILCCLVDKRWSDFQKSLVGIAQLEMSDNVGYFNVTPAFTVAIPTAKYFKLILYATGYGDYVLPDANINIESKTLDKA